MSARTLTLSAVLLAAAAAPTASGFSPPRYHHAAPSSSSSALSMSTVLPAEDAHPNLLSYASLCARSEVCSVDSAESYLAEILNVQGGCGPAAAGTMTGTEVCDDVLGVSRVVAELRAKIKDGAERQVGTFWGQRAEELADLAARADAGPVALLTAPVKPAYLAVFALYVVAVASTFQPGVVDASGVVAPFTAQEAWWAVRDGYVGDLASHAFHHGGLLVGDAAAVGGTVDASGVVAPFAAQEAWWAARDGYVGDLASHAFRHGGLLVGDAAAAPPELLLYAEGGAGAGPFTPQELFFAISHGYSYAMVAHWIRSGGMAV